MDRIKSFTSRWSLKDGAEGTIEPNARRKEQIRRAQQTYRQRKEGYVKSLESEVIHLRTCRSDLLGETRKLTAEIAWLRDAIVQHDIVLPPFVFQDQGQDPGSGPGSESLSVASLSPGQLHYQSESSASVSGSGSASVTSTVRVARDHLNHQRLVVQDSTPSTVHYNGSNNGNNDWQHHAPATLTLTTSPVPKNQGTIDVVVGMNFILTLEAPCLDHVRAALNNPNPQIHTHAQSNNHNHNHDQCENQSHGHALTLTASVFRLSETSPISTPHTPTEDRDHLLTTSTQTLERLLRLSSGLTMADELTPIQVWAFLCQRQSQYMQSRPQGLHGGQVMAIAERLLQYIKCHGYGAVIPRSVVTDVLSSVVSQR
ncbi:hypothetical protein BJX99DRAFT_227005 [Aspergillus californicus]